MVLLLHLVDLLLVDSQVVGEPLVERMTLIMNNVLVVLVEMGLLVVLVGLGQLVFIELKVVIDVTCLNLFLVKVAMALCLVVAVVGNLLLLKKMQLVKQ